MAGLTVTCFLWQDSKAKCRHIYVYGPEHVRRLHGMVERHLETPHEFVCVTDTPDRIDFCRTVELDRAAFVPGTRYAKLMMFRPDIGGILGERILYLDLDCVVTGLLDPLVGRDEDLVLWRNPNFAWVRAAKAPPGTRRIVRHGVEWGHDGTGMKRRARYNTSIMLLRAGARPEFWAEFDPATALSRRGEWGGTDQAWISERADWESEAHWTAADGVYGAGRLKDYDPTVCGTKLPENARIVFFPGSREPGMKETQEKHPWIRKFIPAA